MTESAGVMGRLTALGDPGVPTGTPGPAPAVCGADLPPRLRTRAGAQRPRDRNRADDCRLNRLNRLPMFRPARPTSTASDVPFAYAEPAASRRPAFPSLLGAPLDGADVRAPERSALLTADVVQLVASLLAIRWEKR
jgi:hypothetical protein